jgi:hypothetical protein
MPLSKLDEGLRRVVARVAVLNLTYFGVEFAVALAIGSVSLFADSIDFLEDTSINFLILMALGWDARNRSRVGMILAGILLIPGLATLWTAWHKFLLPVPPEALALSLTGAGAMAVNLACSHACALSHPWGKPDASGIPVCSERCLGQRGDCRCRTRHCLHRIRMARSSGWVRYFLDEFGRRSRGFLCGSQRACQGDAVNLSWKRKVGGERPPWVDTVEKRFEADEPSAGTLLKAPPKMEEKEALRPRSCTIGPPDG